MPLNNGFCAGWKTTILPNAINKHVQQYIICDVNAICVGFINLMLRVYWARMGNGCMKSGFVRRAY